MKKQAKKSKEALKATLEVVQGTAKEKALDQVNKAVITKKITDKKDLKYIYPEDCIDLPSRKAFRTRVRAKLEQLTRKVKMVEKGKIEGDLTKVQKEVEAYRKQVVAQN